MKKKIALLLALVMTFALAMPMTTFAATTNKVSRVTYSAPKYTLYPDQSLLDKMGAPYNTSIGNDATLRNVWRGSGNLFHGDYMGYFGGGVDLLVDFGNVAPAQNGSFKLTLENADFAFMSGSLTPSDWVSGVASAEPQMIAFYESVYNNGKLIGSVNAFIDAYNDFIDDWYRGNVTLIKYKALMTDLAAFPAEKALYDADFAALTALYGKADQAIRAALTAMNTAVNKGVARVDYTVASLIYDDIVLEGADVTSGLGTLNGVTPIANVTDVELDGFFGPLERVIGLAADFASHAAEVADTIDGGSTSSSVGATFNTDNFTPLYVIEGRAPQSGYDYYNDSNNYSSIRWLRLRYDDGVNMVLDIEITRRNETEAIVTYYANTNGASNTNMKVPLVSVSTAAADITAAISETSSTLLSPGTYRYNVYTGTGTSTSVKTQATGRDKVTVNPIYIVENRIGSVTNNWFILQAPDGYKFTSANIANTTLTVSQQGVYTANTDTTTLGSSEFGIYFRNLDKEDPDFQTEVFVKLPANYARSTSIVKTLILDGIVLVPVDYENIPFGDLSMTIWSPATDNTFKSSVASTYGTIKIPSGTNITAAQAGAGVTKQTFKIAKSVDYDVVITADDAAEFYSGLVNQEIAWLEFEETVAKAWSIERDTVLVFTDADGNPLDEVKISDAYMDDHDNVIEEENSVSFRGNTLTLRSLSKRNSERVSYFGLGVEISVEAGFEGPIYVTANVKGATEPVREPILVANVYSPVIVTTKSTDVQIGYSIYPVADVTIEEAEAGLLEYGRQFKIWVQGDTENTILPFNKITMKDNVVVDETSGLKVNLVNSSDVLTFSVTTASRKDKPATIKLSGLGLYINRTISYGKYNIVVGGDFIDNNITSATTTADQLKDKFQRQGVTVLDYVNVVTDPSQIKGAKNNVKITADSDIAVVNGKEFQLDCPVINKDGSMFVPLRFLSYAFGLTTADIIYDDTIKTAYVMAGDNRVVAFKAGSSQMLLNGMPVNIVDANGDPVEAFIVADIGKMYVPFRYAGYAFGYEVQWHEDTKVAEYNPDVAY